MADITAPYIVIIHTNLYSGNFERELAGYVAGVWDGETHGDKEVDIFNDECECDFTGRARFETVDGHDTPVSIWPTPGRFNAGTGLHYDGDDPEHISSPRYPAYESVAMFFNQRPTKEELALLWDRAEKFPDYAAAHPSYRTKGLQIKRLELIHRQVVVTDELLSAIS